MNLLYYFIVLLVLSAAHLLPGEWSLVILYALLGLAAATSRRWLKRSLPWKIIPLAELGAGLLFWLFAWNKDQLQGLSLNMHVSMAALAGIVIGINLVTAALVSWFAFYLTRVILLRTSSFKLS